MTGFSPDEEESSAINKLAKSLYNLVRKKKNRNKGEEWILEEEKDFLESLKFDAREPSVEEEASDENELEGEDNEEKKVEDEGESRSRKRKQFDEVSRTTKHRRVKSVVEHQVWRMPW